MSRLSWKSLIIDSYDNVIRINNFQIEGFEKNVGKKTTLWCVNSWHDISSRKLIVPIICPFKLGDKETFRYQIFINKIGKEPIFAKMSVHDIPLDYKQGATTGFALLYIFSKLNIPVDIFGFDGLKTSHYWDKNHKHDHKGDGDLELEYIMHDKFIYRFQSKRKNVEIEKGDIIEF